MKLTTLSLTFVTLTTCWAGGMSASQAAVPSVTEPTAQVPEPIFVITTPEIRSGYYIRKATRFEFYHKESLPLIAELLHTNTEALLAKKQGNCISLPYIHDSDEFRIRIVQIMDSASSQEALEQRLQEEHSYHFTSNGNYVKFVKIEDLSEIASAYSHCKNQVLPNQMFESKMQVLQNYLDKLKKECKARMDEIDAYQRSGTITLQTIENGRGVDSVFEINPTENGFFIRTILSTDKDVRGTFTVCPAVRDAIKIVSEFGKASGADALKKILRADRTISLEGYEKWYATLFVAGSSLREINPKELAVIDVFVEKLQEKFSVEGSQRPVRIGQLENDTHYEYIRYFARNYPGCNWNHIFPNDFLHQSFDQARTTQLTRIKLLACKLSPSNASSDEVHENIERAQRIDQKCRLQVIQEAGEQHDRLTAGKSIFRNRYARWIGGTVMIVGAVYGGYRLGTYINAQRLAKIAKLVGIKA